METMFTAVRMAENMAMKERAMPRSLIVTV